MNATRIKYGSYTCQSKGAETQRKRKREIRDADRENDIWRKKIKTKNGERERNKGILREREMMREIFKGRGRVLQERETLRERNAKRVRKER